MKKIRVTEKDVVNLVCENPGATPAQLESISLFKWGRFIEARLQILAHKGAIQFEGPSWAKATRYFPNA